jgi:hypothetical protein
MSNAQNNSGATHALVELSNLTDSQRQTLEKMWINSVEGLVGAAASAAGREGLTRVLEMTDSQMAELLQRASQVVGPQRFQDVSAARPGGPTGVLFTDEQKREFRI